MIIQDLSARLQAVCPVVSVTVGSEADRATWGFVAAEHATEAQRAAAAQALSTYDPAAPTPEDVDAERDRRLARLTFAGKVYDFVDANGSETNIAGAATLALAAIVSGAQPGNLRWANPAVDFVWIAADNALVPMDAQTCLTFGAAAADWKARHIYAGRVLKNLQSIPSDYAADARWPA